MCEYVQCQSGLKRYNIQKKKINVFHSAFISFPPTRTTLSWKYSFSFIKSNRENDSVHVVWFPIMCELSCWRRTGRNGQNNGFFGSNHHLARAFCDVVRFFFDVAWESCDIVQPPQDVLRAQYVPVRFLCSAQIGPNPVRCRGKPEKNKK